MKLRSTTLLGAAGLLGAALLACSGMREPVTTDEAEKWHRKYGAPAAGEFETMRSECLQQAQIENPAAVAADGHAEVRFARCMSDKGWCIDTYPCR